MVIAGLRGGWLRATGRPDSPGCSQTPLRYRGGMGRILLIVLAAFVALMVIGVIVSALHFLFVVALIAVVVILGLRLTTGVRRRSRR